MRRKLIAAHYGTTGPLGPLTAEPDHGARWSAREMVWFTPPSDIQCVIDGGTDR